MAFGDLFLEDIRAYRETRLGEAGKRARFPIWGYDTAPLARRFLDAGFRAVLVCVDSRTLDPCFAGRDYDEQLLAELPAGVDPCGENGEFHTFVTAGPIFARPIVCHRCDLVERDGFVKVEVRAFEADVNSNRLVTPRRRCRTLRPGRGAVRSPRLRTPCRNGAGCGPSYSPTVATAGTSSRNGLSGTRGHPRTRAISGVALRHASSER